MQMLSSICLFPILLSQLLQPGDFILQEDDITACCKEQEVQWAFIKYSTQSAWGFDPVGTHIGFFPTADNIFQPVNGWKMPVCGLLDDYFLYDGWGAEYDWNLNIIPNDDFVYIINTPKERAVDISEWKKCKREGCLYDCFQAEITPPKGLRGNKWFPGRQWKHEAGFPFISYDQQPSPLEGREVCVYGPWVLDYGHGCRPEIHPAELIWWKNAGAHSDSPFCAYGWRSR